MCLLQSTGLRKQQKGRERKAREGKGREGKGGKIRRQEKQESKNARKQESKKQGKKNGTLAEEDAATLVHLGGQGSKNVSPSVGVETLFEAITLMFTQKKRVNLANRQPPRHGNVSKPVGALQMAKV